MSSKTKVKPRRMYITDERANKISDAYKYHELLLHYLFIPEPSGSRINSSGFSRKSLILFYCLTYEFVTLRQLCLYLCTDIDRKGLLVYLGRMERDGYLTKKNVVLDEENSPLYFITEKGLKHCYEAMISVLSSSLFVSGNGNSVQENSSHSSSISPSFYFSKLQGDVSAYFLTKIRSSKRRVNYGHTLSVRELNLYLLSNPMTNPHYMFSLEVPVRENGAIVTREQRAKNSFKKSFYTLKSDALLHYPVEGIIYQFFVEQDMCSQRREELLNKINNYVSTLLPAITEKSLSSILFSIHTPCTDYIKKTVSRTKTKVKVSSAVRNYLSPLSSIAWALHPGEDTDACMLKDIVDVFEGLCASSYPEYNGNVFNSNALKYYKSVLKNNPNISIGELYTLTKSEKNKRDDLLDDVRNFYLRARYISRRTSMFDSFMKIDELNKYILAGVSIFTSHSEDHGSTFPYLVPEMFGGKRFLNGIVGFSLFNGVVINNTFFKPYCGNVIEDGYVLKNHYIFDDVFHVLVENISDDLGGRCRVLKYLTNPVWKKCSGILLCLVADDDIETARNLYVDSYYANNHPHSIVSSLTATLTLNEACKEYISSIPADGTFALQVYFISYSNFHGKFDLFTFDKKGNIVPRR